MGHSMGYKRFYQFKDGDDEKAFVNKWVIDSLKNPRLFWGDGETNQDDPRSQTEDLGDDADEGKCIWNKKSSVHDA
jgi:hypothetical protein